MNILQRTELFQAQFLFAAACAMSRAHDKLAQDALYAWGEHGPQVSSIVREHFPEAVKTALYTMARNVSKYVDMAYQAKPSGVRNSTMRKLASAVARRDGSGFYGPRP